MTGVPSARGIETLSPLGCVKVRTWSEPLSLGILDTFAARLQAEEGPKKTSTHRREESECFVVAARQIG
jgi:hypothetical protein